MRIDPRGSCPHHPRERRARQRQRAPRHEVSRSEAARAPAGVEPTNPHAAIGAHVELEAAGSVSARERSELIAGDVDGVARERRGFVVCEVWL